MQKEQITNEIKNTTARIQGTIKNLRKTLKEIENRENRRINISLIIFGILIGSLIVIFI